MKGQEGVGVDGNPDKSIASASNAGIRRQLDPSSIVLHYWELVFSQIDSYNALHMKHNLYFSLVFSCIVSLKVLQCPCGAKSMFAGRNLKEATHLSQRLRFGGQSGPRRIPFGLPPPPALPLAERITTTSRSMIVPAPHNHLPPAAR